jgi:hypothetical protein
LAEPNEFVAEGDARVNVATLPAASAIVAPFAFNAFVAV